MHGDALMLVGHAYLGVAHKAIFAGNEAGNTHAAIPVGAHAFACLRACVASGHEHAHRLTILAAMNRALSAIIREIPALDELNQVPLAVAPPVLAVPRALRREPAQRLQLKGAYPARARRLPTAKIARLLAICRR
jgi:hypothetical protein